MSTLGLTREQAYDIVVDKLGQSNMLKHVLAVEVAMRTLAEQFGEDIELWGLTGLVHDLDALETANDEAKHSYLTTQWLEPYNLPPALLHAINAHPGHIPCETRLDWGLYAVDPATGFVVACALMHPDKKLASIDADFMLRRFKEKRFAAGARRENMAACSEFGMELGSFLSLVLGSMLTISKQLGL